MKKMLAFCHRMRDRGIGTSVKRKPDKSGEDLLGQVQIGMDANNSC